jgi:hypothetical protein
MHYKEQKLDPRCEINKHIVVFKYQLSRFILYAHMMCISFRITVCVCVCVLQNTSNERSFSSILKTFQNYPLPQNTASYIVS